MKLVNTLNTVSGQVGLVPEHYLEIPGVKDTLVRVDEDAKSYEPSMYKPTTAKEHGEKKTAPQKLQVSKPDKVSTEDEDTQPLDMEIK